MSLGPQTEEDFAPFIAANTILMAPPHVPEIRLHLAEESLPIWQKTEEELGEMNVPPPFWAFAWAGGQALARYLLDTPIEVSGKTVLDLGTGSGLTAIAAMKAGAISSPPPVSTRLQMTSPLLRPRRTSCWICPLTSEPSSSETCFTNANSPSASSPSLRLHTRKVRASSSAIRSGATFRKIDLPWSPNTRCR
jgi:Ribosomal protein L11 methyltransferase (PrmA)